MTNKELREELDIKDLKYDAESAVRKAMNRGYSAGYRQGYDDARAEMVNKPSEKVPEELVIMLAKIFGGIGDYEDITIGELIEAKEKMK